MSASELIEQHHIPVAESQDGEEDKDASDPHHEDDDHHNGVAVALFYYTNKHAIMHQPNINTFFCCPRVLSKEKKSEEINKDTFV